MASKEHLNLIFIGHVDHGKSTTVGRILYETGALSEQQLRKLKEEAEKVGKATFEFAFTMDTLKEERERGVTIDLSHKEFNTAKYDFTIIDAPGHRDFVKNMITGASQADAAVIVCSAKDGVQAQTKEHAFLAKVLGISQFVIGINKMDAVEWKEDAYNTVVAELKGLLKNVGYKVDEIPYVPYSAFTGGNIASRSEKSPWYKGPTLLECFDKFTVPAKPKDKPLRMPIQDVFTITGHGTVPVGRVESGVLKPGMNICIMPSGVKTDVKKIEMHHKELKEAIPGDNVGFNIKGVDKKDVQRGNVIGPADVPPTVAEEFKAQVVVLDHPTAIAKGYTPVFHLHTAQIACTVVEILEKKDPKTGQTMEKNPDFIKTGDIAILKIKPLRPVVVEKFSEFPALGRFA
ncbi:translation elongation factor EF-1 subunit alpha, partial [Candidatus Micrarchaeota archaeon CG10_big_fil_rev_8_21_14_0_10_45_29]